MTNYEEATAFLGQWGRFQQIFFFVLCASTIPIRAGLLSIVFVAAVPSHHCTIPEGANLTREWLSVIIPTEVVNGKEEPSRCSRYRLDVVRNLSAQGYIPGRDVNLTDLGQEGCTDGWSYSTDVYQSTIVSEFDLVCDDQWKQPFTSTICLLGALIGSSIQGQLSDRYGRRPIFFITMAFQSTFIFAQVFSPSWAVFATLIFFSGFGSNYLACFVLGAETFTGKVRILFSALGVHLFLTLGYMLLPLAAYFLRDWRSLLMALSLPSLLYIPLWWFLPESPQWLLSQGRVMEAEAIIRNAAKKNKVEAPMVIFEDYGADENKTPSKNEKQHTVFDLIRTSTIRATTLVICFVGFSLRFGYFALSLNTSKLSADPYVSCFISAAIEVPASISSWLAMRYLPRRLSASCLLLPGGLLLFFIQLVPQTLPVVAVALEMLAKYSIITSLAIVGVVLSELYPTTIRNTGAGLCASISRMGSCLSPFLLQLSVYSRYLPYIILGIMSVMSAAAVLFLPESFGQPLPETIEQMQMRGRMNCPCITSKEKEQPVVLISQL